MRKGLSICFVKKENKMKVKNIGHLGIVAGMCEELEIVEMIDKIVLKENDRIVSHGEAVKAMILNSLGFSMPLYMTPDFFKDKPTEVLIGEGITPKHLNDVTLGRTLDKLYEFNVTDIFSKISSNASVILGLDSKIAHLDSTSFSVYGEYDKESEEGIIEIRRGYSRDKRGDLNQLVLNMISENRASLPLYIEVCSGNQSDKVKFREILNRQVDNLVNYHGIEYVVVDSALYTKDNLETLKELKSNWITRVPNSLNIVKSLIEDINFEKFKKIDDKYLFLETESNYGEYHQRWVVYWSEEAQNRGAKSVLKKFEKISENDLRKIRKFELKRFETKESAIECLEALKKELKISFIENYELFEDKKNSKAKVKYRINLTYSSDNNFYMQERKRKGVFVLATNQFKIDELKAEDILNEYKNQGKVERGFRFLKDPKFHTDSLFLKKPERIMALMMIMTLSLMVYSAIEHKIREELKNKNLTFPNQKRKQIQNPTARWIFQYFRAVSFVLFGDEKELQYFDENHFLILKILGEKYEKKYT